ncbi:MAG: DNA repair protein RecO C-terminal domain-containing protein, partial [Alphaproteobacteria bacterium]|nr:DNA repair protein RecO C-terminal domain-containing protein [Alphaproteobacteria bacterium]
YLEHNDTPLARILHQGEKVLFLKAVTHLLEKALPERHAYPHLYLYVDDLFKTMHHRKDIFYAYAQLEYILVHELGYGFDLSSCALCGLEKELHYISPKSGRGACTPCGFPFKDKLFAHPWGLFERDNAHTHDDLCQKSLEQIQKSLKITGFFLSEYVIKQVRGSSPLPPIRDHFIEMLSQNVA